MGDDDCVLVRATIIMLHNRIHNTIICNAKPANGPVKAIGTKFYFCSIDKHVFPQ